MFWVESGLIGHVDTVLSPQGACWARTRGWPGMQGHTWGLLGAQQHAWRPHGGWQLAWREGSYDDIFYQ